MELMHNADGEPSRSPAGFGDHPTSVSLFAPIMLGLYQRDRTGAGCKVSTTLMANGVWSNSCQIQAALCKAAPVERTTRTRTDNPLVNHYLTRDGRRFLLCCLDAAQDWPHLCCALARPELAAEPRFATHALRSVNAVELVEIFDREFARADMVEWKRRFAEHEVIRGPAPSYTQVAGDEQMQANGVFTEVQNAPGGPVRTVANPITVEGAEQVSPKMAPAVGEHSVEILRELGYNEAASAEMIERGVTMPPPKDAVGCAD